MARTKGHKIEERKKGVKLQGLRKCWNFTTVDVVVAVTVAVAGVGVGESKRGTRRNDNAIKGSGTRDYTQGVSLGFRIFFCLHWA